MSSLEPGNSTGSDNWGSMKVLDLECSQHHVFEGWFGSEDDFHGQLARARVECPLCGDTHAAKGLSAPRITLGASAPAKPKQDVMAPGAPAMQAKWLQMARHVRANPEEVGKNSAEDARRIHYGET